MTYHGILSKQSKTNGAWQPRHCAINGSFLTLHKTDHRAPEDLVAMVDIAQISHIEIKPSHSNTLNPPFNLMLWLKANKKHMNHAEVPTADENTYNAGNQSKDGKLFVLQANTCEDAQGWATSLLAVRDKAMGCRKPSQITRSQPSREDDEEACRALAADLSKELSASLEDEADLTETADTDFAEMLRDVVESAEKRSPTPLEAIRKAIDMLEAIAFSPTSISSESETLPEDQQQVVEELSSLALSALTEAVEAVSTSHCMPSEENTSSMVEMTAEERLQKAEETIAQLAREDATPSPAIIPNETEEESLEEMMDRWAADAEDGIEESEEDEEEEAMCSFLTEASSSIWQDTVSTAPALCILPSSLNEQSTRATDNARSARGFPSTSLLGLVWVSIVILGFCLPPQTRSPVDLFALSPSQPYTASDLLAPIPHIISFPADTSASIAESDELPSVELPYNSTTSGEEETIDEVVAQIEAMLASVQPVDKEASAGHQVAPRSASAGLLQKVRRILAEAPQRLLQALLRLLTRTPAQPAHR